MRLSHIALFLTLILLAVTGYLAWEAKDEARGAQRELELMRRQQAARDAAKPIAPVTVAEIPPPPEPQPAPAPAPEAPPLAGSGLMPGTPAAPPPAAPLTALQKQVLGMVPIAKIVDVQREQGFAVINAGKDKKLEKGARYDVRRNEGLVGRVIVGEIIDQNEAVVDIDPSASLPGVSIEVGDELILPVRK